MMLIEIRPTNPLVSGREFIRFDQIQRIWREIEDGGWNAVLNDGKRPAPIIKRYVKLRGQTREKGP